MLIVVTRVSSVVHVYSIGYMSHDHSSRASWPIFAVHLLHADAGDRRQPGPDVLRLGRGGRCLYLLIGFWYDKPTPMRRRSRPFSSTGLAISALRSASSASSAVRHVSLRRRSSLPCRHRSRHDFFLALPRDDQSFACCCSSAPWANRPSLACTPGCRTRWKARHRSRR